MVDLKSKKTPTAVLLALLLAWLPAHSKSPETETDYLQRAEEYRQAGDRNREQFELTSALRRWPNSITLRYTYALHLVRRKNLAAALVQTTYSLGQNRDQPNTANLHLLLLDGLGRTAEGVTWVTELLWLNRAQPPLEPWPSAWVERWRQVLLLGRKQAGNAGNSEALALINDALAWPMPNTPQDRGN